MSLKLDAVAVPADLRKCHERQGGAELEMYSVARPGGFLRLTVGAEPVVEKGPLVTHISVSYATSSDPAAPTTRRPSDKELREVRAHFAYVGTFEEDNSASDAGGQVRHLWGEGENSRRQAARTFAEEFRMERAVEWYALVTCVVMGLSHILQPRAWADVFAALHRLGKPGAFFNGGLSLLPGAVFVAAHPVWSGPAVVLTLLGWLMVLKGAGCFLVPNLALRSMGKAGAGNGREFIVGGLSLLAFAGVLGYALWAK